MKASFIVIGLLVLGCVKAESNCWEFTKELIEQNLTPGKLQDQLDLWESECAEEIESMQGSLAENKDLQTTYQTFLFATDLALVYYSRQQTWSLRTYSVAKAARDFFNWNVMIGTVKRSNALNCATANFKVVADLYAYYEGTFGDSALILLDFQVLREQCPDSPLLYISEFINKYLIPPTAPKNDYALEIEPRYGVCAMRASFAYLSWAMTQNAKSNLSTMILFLNYGTTIFKLQVANANCEFII